MIFLMQASYKNEKEYNVAMVSPIYLKKIIRLYSRQNIRKRGQKQKWTKDIEEN